MICAYLEDLHYHALPGESKQTFLHTIPVQYQAERS